MAEDAVPRKRLRAIKGEITALKEKLVALKAERGQLKEKVTAKKAAATKPE